MSTINLRRWQKEAFDTLGSHGRADFLTVATPGAGKTTFALTVACRWLSAGAGRQLVVVAPTRHLKEQWARAGTRLGLVLADSFDPRLGLPADVHGVVTTYQQVATDPDAVARCAAGRMVILDEVHHAGSDRTWGDALETAFAHAPVRLALSGTPFRSDTSRIPFVDYVHGEARPDYTYGYTNALDDGVVRPVRFTRIGGEMEWIDPDGSTATATFDDDLDPPATAQRLRTALDPAGQLLPAMLGTAHRKLLDHRTHVPDAGGLVLTSDQHHARAVARILQATTGASVTVAVSEDPTASDRVARFAAGEGDWLVAVRLVSEGVDVPRLTTLAWATTTSTELFFRQAVGRVVRARAGEQLVADVVMPDDPRLRACANRMKVEVLHAAADTDAEPADAADEQLDPVPAEPRDRGEQLSMFAPIAAEHDGRTDETPPDPTVNTSAGTQSHAIELPPLPPLVRSVPLPEMPDDLTHSGQVAWLRKKNAAFVRRIVARSGLEHATVNAELNQAVGVDRVATATRAQLEARLRAAAQQLAV